MRRDAIFYTIFKRVPGLFFELVEQPPAEASSYRFESVEVKEPTFRIDGVFLPPPDATSQTIFFAEGTIAFSPNRCCICIVTRHFTMTGTG